MQDAVKAVTSTVSCAWTAIISEVGVAAVWRDPAKIIPPRKRASRKLPKLVK